MKSLAILVDNLGYSQKSIKIIDEINKISTNYNPVVFIADYTPLAVKPNFPVMELVKAYEFKGDFIATDIFTTQVMNNCHYAKKKFLYVWDLEYLYNMFSFDILNSIYNNPSVELIARNQYRYNILTNTWKEPKSIMQDFDHKTIEALI